MQIEGSILAGGKSTRYGGRNKAFLMVEGEQIIDRIINVFSPLFSQISIITNNKEQFLGYLEYSISSDYYKNIGPLAGIHSVLKNMKAEGVFIASCDMPFLDKILINKIIGVAQSGSADAVIPRVKGKIEPLFAFYHQRILDKLEDHIDNFEDRSIRSFLQKINTVYVEFDDSTQVRKSFTNINRPEDLAQLNS